IDAEMLKGHWDVTPITVDEQPGLEFSYRLTDAQMRRVGLAGPVQVIKRYWLPKLSEDQRVGSHSRTFHVHFQLEVVNQSDVDQMVGLQLNGLTGTPTEGWWYQHKIHASSTAIGYTAGARDVVCSTSHVPYRFLSGPEIVTNTLKPAPAFQYLIDPTRPVPEDEVLRYVGVDTQYFHAALLPAESPENSRTRYLCYSILGGVASSEIPKVSFKRRLVDCSFYLFDRLELPAQGSFRQSFDVFVGPKEPQLLERYGLEDNRTFGWFAWLSKTLVWLLGFFYTITFQFSYGLAIILLTVFVRVLMIPWGRKAAANAQMMQLLAPEMKAIAEKHKDEPEKRIAAQRDLFRRHKYNPFSGCLIVLIQLPIFMGLYRGLSVDIALRDQPLIPGMRWCSNLAAPDQLLYWKNWMPSWLGDETGWFGPWFNLLPIATIVLFLIQQKLFMPPATDDQQRMTQRMMTWMMIFLGFMFFKVPSGLCIYFVTSSIWSILERKLLPPVKLSDDKVNAVKSASSQRDEGAQNGDSSNTPKRDTLSNKMVNRFREMVEGKGKPKEVPLDAEAKKKLDRERRRKLRERES
ncbi:MAG TPA: YidC/Oxa1 family insertase periplasmic-domain containing protein, partial [Pirellulaceae bacterium]|nr:YidC/Oxa1 family insertase periplasmic-domain containing protein [Pirellulaceae bacterium]